MRMKLESGGLWGLLLLIADIYAIVSVVGSNATTGKKVRLDPADLFLPLLGFRHLVSSPVRAGADCGSEQPGPIDLRDIRPCGHRIAGLSGQPFADGQVLLSIQDKAVGG